MTNPFEKLRAQYPLNPGEFSDGAPLHSKLESMDAEVDKHIAALREIFRRTQGIAGSGETIATTDSDTIHKITEKIIGVGDAVQM